MLQQRKLAVLSAGLLASLLATSAIADKKDVQIYTDSWGEIVFIDCLGEYFQFSQNITAAYREFVTPSGVYHYVEDVRTESLYVGLSSGREYVATGHSPGRQAAGPANAGGWTYLEKAVPVDGKGPGFMYHSNVQWTFNANGDLKVFIWYHEPWEETLRCVGPGK